MRHGMGDTKGGSFDVMGNQAREWLCLPANPNGRTNADVLKPWVNGMDHLPWHPDTETYTVFNSARVWWLWLTGRDVIHHDVEAVIGNEPPFPAPVERCLISGQNSCVGIPGRPLVSFCGHLSVSATMVERCAGRRLSAPP